MSNIITNRTLIISGPARTIQRGKLTKVITDSDWAKFIQPITYPLWDSDKDILVSFTFLDQPEEYWKIEKKKFVRNHTTGEYYWKDYFFTEVTADEVNKFVDDICEAFEAICSVDRHEFDFMLDKILKKEKGLSLSRIKAWRDFFLYSSDWTMLEDAPITPEEKEQWRLYRQKVRELPDLFESKTQVLPEIRVPIDPIVYRKNYAPYHPDSTYLDSIEQWVWFPTKDHPGGALDQAMLDYMKLAVRMSRPAPLFNVPSVSHFTDPIDTLVAEIEREQKMLDELRAQQNDTTTS